MVDETLCQRVENYLTDVGPVGIQSCCCFVDREYPLLPSEAAFVAQSCQSRRQEFSVGRNCTRIALGKLGLANIPITVGEFRQPLWPTGIVGSITHDENLAAAVVVSSSAVAGIGIDIHRVLEVLVYDEIRPVVFSAYDNLNQNSLPAAFSCKETVIKAASPILGRPIEFTEVILNLVGHNYTATLKDEKLFAEGHWLKIDGLIISIGSISNGSR